MNETAGRARWAMQLIVVTAAAVLLSNMAVAVWFELGDEKHNETR